MDKSRIFLSYSRKDEATVIKLEAALNAADYIDVLRDKHDILPAEDWRLRLEGLIVSADALVICISPDSLRSNVVGWEIETADRLSKRIIPVVIREFEDSVPKAVARLNYIFMYSAEQWQDSLKKLISAIGADIEWVREHTRIGELAQRWETSGQRRDDLLRGVSLEKAEIWVAKQPHNAPKPSQLQHAFIAASRQNAMRRQRVLITGSLLVATMALVLSALAYWQRGIAMEQRTSATARQLSIEAQAMLADPLAKPDTAIRNLLISMSLSPSQAAADGLTLGTPRLPPRKIATLPWPADDAKPRSAAFSRDGLWLGIVTTSEVIIWDTKSHLVKFRHKVSNRAKAPSIAFTDQAPRILVTESGKNEPGSTTRWTAINFSTGQIETADSDDALDVKIIGSEILALQKVKGKSQAVIVDLMSGTILRRMKLAPSSGRLVFGQLISGTSPPSTGIDTMASSSPPRRPLRRALFVDDKGIATIFPPGYADPGKLVKIPEGFMPLRSDATTGLLAIRHPESGDAVINPDSGDVIWKARNNTKSFQDFAAAGRFLIVADKLGAGIVSIDGGFRVSAKHARRTDWDLDVIRYTAPSSSSFEFDIAERTGLIATAHEDGKVYAYGLEKNPRRGAFGPLPKVNIVPVASIDHGQILKAISPKWKTPPVLFVSPNGRYIASQSIGRKTNVYGTPIKMAPLVRIWDSRYGKEVARFSPFASMLIAFAPSGRVMATISAKPDTGDHYKVNTVLELWGLGDHSPPFGERNETQSIALTPIAKLSAGAKFSRTAAPLWLGADLRLRVLDSQTNEIVVVDDLTPAIRDFAAHLADFSKPNNDKTKNAPNKDGKIQATEADFLSSLKKMAADFPAEAPMSYFPVAISEDRRRAVVALGLSVRLYTLDGTPRLLRVFNAELADSILLPSPLGLVISPNGDAFAVTFMQSPTTHGPPLNIPGAPKNLPGTPKDKHNLVQQAQTLVFNANQGEPVHVLPQRVFIMPMSHTRLMKQLIALGPEGRLILVDEISFGTGPMFIPEVKARLQVRDLKSGEVPLTLSERDLYLKQLQNMEADFGFPPSGAFDPAGTKLVVMREHPDCPMQKDKSGMPIKTSLCRDRRIALSVWDIKRRKHIVTNSFIVRPPDQSENLMAITERTRMTAISANYSLTNAARIAMEDADPPVVSLEIFDAQVAGSNGGAALKINRVNLRIPLGQNRYEDIAKKACKRLPDELRRLAEVEWSKIVPNETYREICHFD